MWRDLHVHDNHDNNYSGHLHYCRGFNKQEDMGSGYHLLICLSSLSFTRIAVLPHLAALRGAAPLRWAFMRVRRAVFHVNVCLLRVLPLRFTTCGQSPHEQASVEEVFHHSCK